MKILSFNIRGMGISTKRNELKKLLVEEKPNCIFIQETKLEVVNPALCEWIWGNSNCDWVFLPSNGRSGGLLCIWGLNFFTISNSFYGAGYLGISGLWSDNTPCNFINVYSPCDFHGKSELWQNLVREVRTRGGDVWCVLGDFNAVKCSSERKGSSVASNREMAGFSNFIEDASLQDIPMSGRKYTWSSPSGSSMSRLDKFLISAGWLSKWPNSVQKGHSSFISDHCAISLFDSHVDWGPKPFRTLDCWFDHPEFRDFVKKEWGELSYSGKKAFVLKEKIKALKNSLKIWNKEIFGFIDVRIHEQNKELDALNMELEDRPSNEEDAHKKQEIISNLWQ